jgi:hypothetical protein
MIYIIGVEYIYFIGVLLLMRISQKLHSNGLGINLTYNRSKGLNITL